MMYADLILIAILLYYFFHGFRKGLIRVIGGLVGILIGSYLAGKYGAGFEGSMKFVAFFVIFIVANKLTSFIFYLLDKLFNFVAIIPGLSTVNRIAGGIIGLVEGTILLGITLYVAQRLAFLPLIKDLFAQTEFAQPLATIGGVFLPLYKQLF